MIRQARQVFKDALTLKATRQQVIESYLKLKDVDYKYALQRKGQPLVLEVFTDVEPIRSAAERAGHNTMPSMTLNSGYQFLDPKHRQRALDEIR